MKERKNGQKKVALLLSLVLFVSAFLGNGIYLQATESEQAVELIGEVGESKTQSAEQKEPSTNDPDTTKDAKNGSKPSIEPSVNPSTDPSEDPSTEPSEKPSTDPSLPIDGAYQNPTDGTALQIQENKFMANFYKYRSVVVNQTAKDIYENSKILNTENPYPGYIRFEKGGVTDAASTEDWNKNHYEGVYQGLVENKLSDSKKPIFRYATDALFDEQGGINSNRIGRAEKNVALEIKKGEDGYYEYDSNKDGMRVRDGKATLVKEEKGFWPLWRNQDCVDWADQDRHYFGMEFGMKFYTTSDGKIPNPNGKKDERIPMEFEFSGDDDVWIFVDDKLVIDLGGIHPAQKATINFETGIVTYAKGDKGASKGAIYSPAGAETEVDFYSRCGWNKTEFLNQEEHELRMFYMERGEYESNCKIRFNLPQTPQQNCIEVTNTVESKLNDEVLEDDTACTYFLTKGDSAVPGYKYKKSGQTLQTGANGEFTLKNGETAIFSPIDEGTYTVKQKLEPTQNFASSVDAELIEGGQATQKTTVEALEESSEYIGKKITFPKRRKGTDQVIVSFENKREAKYTTTKTAKLVNWKERIYEIHLRVSQSSAKALPGVAPSQVVDYIDPRFELNATNTNATVSKEGKYQKLIWNLDTTSESTFWEKTFQIKAKENYLGGNHIPTNREGDGYNRVKISGMLGTSNISRFLEFDHPYVNVRTDVFDWKSESTIFLGETLDGYYQKDCINAYNNVYDGKNQQDVILALGTWRNKETNESIAEADMPKQAPEKDTTYETTLTVTPKVADTSDQAREAAEAMQNSDGNDKGCYTASMRGDETEQEHPTEIQGTGTYNVHVLSGELTIQKDFDLEYLQNLPYSERDKELIHAKQSAVFTIERFAPEDTGCKNVLETYQTVLSYDDKQETGSSTASVKLVNLKKGFYKVSEDTKWSWKYQQKGVQDTDAQTVVGVLYIGRESSNAKAGFFGTAGTKEGEEGFAKITFQNALHTDKKWYSDTCHVNNQFNKRNGK